MRANLFFAFYQILAFNFFGGHISMAISSIVKREDNEGFLLAQANRVAVE